MDAIKRNSIELPSIAFLDRDKSKPVGYPDCHSQSPVSPHSYSSYPSHTQPTYSSSVSQPDGQLSPPASRRVSDDEIHPPLPSDAHRLSLPSLQEALAGSQDSPRQYSIAPLPRADPLPHVYRTAGITRQPSSVTASFTSDPRPQEHQRSLSHSAQNHHHANERPYHDHVRHHTPPPSEPAKLPTLHPHVKGPNPTLSNNLGSSHHEPYQSTRPEQPSHGSEPSYSHYADRSYPPNQPSSQSSIVAPTASYPPQAPSSIPSRPAHAEDVKPDTPQSAYAPYSSSVKRNLVQYDVESALNIINEVSHVTLGVTQQCCQVAHQSQKAGMPYHGMPSLDVLDDLLRQNNVARTQLQRLKEMATAQQIEIAENNRDQRHQALEGRSLEADPYGDDPKDGGYGPNDPKKRRGRAALPGRCHSCNRLETPEWRRGPDGARTLCNACGLHWAKLKRKQEGKADSRRRSSAQGASPT